MTVACVEIFRDRKRQIRWRLKAANGRIIATGEAHRSSRDAERAWRGVEQIVLLGKSIDCDPLPVRDLKARAK